MSDALPEGFLTAIEALATDRGLDASDARLGAQVRRVSETYTTRRSGLEDLVGDRGALSARLRFFLPRDVVKIRGPLTELLVAGALPSRPLRVLDIGAGVGATALGFAWFAMDHELAVEEIVAVDRDDEALSLLSDLYERWGAPGRLRTSRDDATALPAGPFDLVLAGLVLNELHTSSDPAPAVETLTRWGEAMAPDGSLVVVEPALRSTTRALHRVRDVLSESGALSVFAPCVRKGPCPLLSRPKDWCHEDRPFALPPRLAEIARRAGLRYERSTYAYLTLRRDGRSIAELSSQPEHLHRVVSQPLPSKGKLELVLCSDVGDPRLQRLNRHRSEANAAIDRTVRGDLVQVAAPADPKRIRVGPDVAVERVLAADTGRHTEPGGSARHREENARDA